MAVVPREVGYGRTRLEQATETDVELTEAVRKNFGEIFVRWHPLGGNVEFWVVFGGGLGGAFSTEKAADAEATLQVGRA
jgi:hypothetical protein